MKLKFTIAFFMLLKTVFGQEFSMLDVSLDYYSNTSSFGVLNQIKEQPSYALGLSYLHKENFILSAMPGYLENSDSTFENGTFEVDVIAGYNFELNKHFSIFPSYTHFFYDKDANTLFSSYQNNFAIDFSAVYKVFNSSFTVNYLTGESNDYFLVFQNYFAFGFDNLLFKNSLFSIEPEVTLNFGNQTYYNNYLWENYQNDKEFKAQILNNQKIKRLIWLLQRRNPDLTEDQIIGLLSLSQIEEDNDFNLSSVSIALPLVYMIGNVSINSGLSCNILTNKPDYIEEDVQFYYSLGISYSFMFE